jgi:hypothetical protein
LDRDTAKDMAALTPLYAILFVRFARDTSALVLH